ncbi:hypothetical protein KGD83_02265 [Nocardiopsis akebiae]|uniref:ArsR family transcriptional regulator n=1 Tax=Nocardiopsis akebiae TaxID=2831968 RepID=A0ABX8CA59_9ACTN|nr:hypothetical protein [Nocardiopsis akebiae]QUX29438.1 hypothetical protein KGD83_02265 [Nocardiopsis akebiae]
MFPLPDKVRRDVLIALLHGKLRNIRTRSVERVSGVWSVTRSGLERL